MAKRWVVQEDKQSLQIMERRLDSPVAAGLRQIRRFKGVFPKSFAEIVSNLDNKARLLDSTLLVKI